MILQRSATVATLDGRDTMTTTIPRLADAAPSRARNAAALALALAHPDTAILVDDAPAGTSALSARLSMLRKRQDAPANLISWTETRDGVTLGFIKLVVAEPLPAKVKPQARTSINERYRRTRLGMAPASEKTRATLRERNQRALERISRAGGVQIPVATTAATDQGTADRYRRRQKSLLDFAARSGVKITTKVVVAAGSTRLDAKLIKG